MGKYQTGEPDYESCVGYYRNALSPRRAAQERHYLEANPDVARRAQADASHESAIAQALEGVLREPVPARLTIDRQPATAAWSRRLTFSATIVLSATTGWWLGNMPAATNDGNDTSFTQRVVSAARHPIKPTGLQTVARTSQAVPAPDLSPQGYQLLRQQKLDNTQPALIEFVYRNAGSQRLRIYAEAGPGQHKSPTVSSHQGLAVAQWREGDTRYALVGNMPKLSLRTLAQAAQTGTPDSGDTLADNRRPLTSQAGTDQINMPVQTVTSPQTNEIVPSVPGHKYTVQPARM